MKPKRILGTLLFNISMRLLQLVMTLSFLNSNGYFVRVRVTKVYHDLTGTLEYRESK